MTASSDTRGQPPEVARGAVRFEYCVAELVGFELRNVMQNIPLKCRADSPECSRNSGHRDYSRLSCGVEDTQLGPSARISAALLARMLVNRRDGRNCRDFVPIQR